ADTLDAAAHEPFNANGDDFEKLVTSSVEKARSFMALHIHTRPLSANSLNSIRQTIVTTHAELRRLADRAPAMIDQARFQELLAKGSELGGRLLSIAYYNLDSLKVGLADELRHVGHDLHVLDTTELLLGSGPVNEAMRCIEESVAALEKVVVSLPTRRR